VIFIIAVFVSVFATIEVGIYTSVGCSVALLLYRIARPRGAFLGRVRLRPDVAPRPPTPTEKETGGSGSVSPVSPVLHRDVYLPLLPDGVRNPLVQVDAPPPGVIVYRFEESFLFPNASFCTSSLTFPGHALFPSLTSLIAPLHPDADVILDFAKKHTRSGHNYDGVPTGDRPWNDPGELPWRKNKGARTPEQEAEAEKPLLRAVVFDMSSCSNIDTTSVQNIVDLKNSLERYSGTQVQFHFASILSPYIKRCVFSLSRILLRRIRSLSC